MRAVIDTGAGSLMVSPALAEKLNSPKRPWDGATLELANGIRKTRADAVEIPKSQPKVRRLSSGSGSHHGDGLNLSAT